MWTAFRGSSQSTCPRRTGYTFSLALTFDSGINSTEEAVAVPGGYIFIPATLLLAAQDEAEFAGMLAHSMAHVVARHGTRQATRGQLANLSTVPLIFMGGWTGRQNQNVLVPLGFLGFMRLSEGEADRIAAEAMAAAGFDPAAFHRYVARTQQDPADITRSSLPARDERLGAIQTTIAALPARTYSASAYFIHAQNELRSLLPPPRKAPSLREPPLLRRP